MTRKIVMTLCAVACLIASGAMAKTVVRGAGEGFVLANVAPPEPEEPKAPPAAAPTDTAPANAPSDAPAAAAPEVPPAADAQAGTPDTNANGDQPASGTPPWTWIAVGVAIVGALGFGLWWGRGRG